MTLRATRRGFLSLAGAFALLPGGLALANAPTDRRFVFVVLRGGMDGLAAVPPMGDPDYAAARGALALPPDTPRLLDRRFGLHPALDPALPLYRKGDLLVVQAVASPYRERSHFDGQDVLEGGGDKPHALHDGWMNRALQALGKVPAMAVGQGIPLALRGDAPATSWAPSPLPGLSPDQARRLVMLYEGDPLFAQALDDGLQMEAFVAGTLGEGAEAQMAKDARDFAKLAAAAGKLLAAPDGPRLAVMECGGWDTHTAQGLGTGRMALPLAQLANGLAGLAGALGPVWDKTVVVAASEFGRTVAANGTGGTDHGTAGAVLVAGGSLKGGRVLGDWPGLARENLHQGRDLKPTTDLRAVLKGLLQDHLGLERAVLDEKVFPGSATVRPMEGLVKAG